MTTTSHPQIAALNLPPLDASSVGQALGQRMPLLHGHLLELVPAVDRNPRVLLVPRAASLPNLLPTALTLTARPR